MTAGSDLLQAIIALGAKRWSGELYRHTSPGREPMSGVGARLFGGRWNPRDSFPTLYLAEPVDACVGEFLRMAQGQGRGADSLLPRSLHVISADDLELVDLTPEGALDEVGLTMDDIAGDDWSSCQEIGRAVYFLGYQGIRVPSATGLGTTFAVFGTRLRTGQLRVGETRSIVSYL